MPEYTRLSDEILKALTVALDQEDIEIASTLNQALEQSMTRNAGGGDFVERRNFPDEIDQALKRLDALKAKSA